MTDFEKAQELEKKGFHRRAVTLLKDYLLTITGSASNGYFESSSDQERSDVVRRIRRNSRAKLRPDGSDGSILSTSEYNAGDIDYD